VAQFGPADSGRSQEIKRGGAGQSAVGWERKCVRFSTGFYWRGAPAVERGYEEPVCGWRHLHSGLVGWEPQTWGVFLFLWFWFYIEFFIFLFVIVVRNDIQCLSAW
jgi:hypothetical protein